MDSKTEKDTQATRAWETADDELVRTFLNANKVQLKNERTFVCKVMLHLPKTIYNIAIGLNIACGLAAMYVLANLLSMANLDDYRQLSAFMVKYLTFSTP